MNFSVVRFELLTGIVKRNLLFSARQKFCSESILISILVLQYTDLLVHDRHHFEI